jgi:hypothetical protein
MDKGKVELLIRGTRSNAGCNPISVRSRPSQMSIDDNNNCICRLRYLHLALVRVCLDRDWVRKEQAPHSDQKEFGRWVTDPALCRRKSLSTCMEAVAIRWNKVPWKILGTR